MNPPDVMPAIEIITVMRMTSLIMRRGAVESGGIKPADRQQDFQRHVSAGCLDQPIAVKSVIEPGLDPLDFLQGDEIDFIEDEHVGEGYLTELQFHHLRGREDLLRVQDTHDAVQPDAVPHVLVHEREGNAGRVSHSAGLKHEVFGLLGTSHHLRHRRDQILADVAADTAIGEIDDVPIVFNSDHELGVNVDRAKVVHQYGDPEPVITGQDAIQQRRLAGAEKPGQDRQGDGLRGSWAGRGHFGSPPSSLSMICWSFSCSPVSLACISRTFFWTTWRTSTLKPLGKLRCGSRYTSGG